MRNSLEQSQDMLNQSQAGWAQSALNSLAQEILKTCQSVPNAKSNSIILNDPAIENAVWSALQRQKGTPIQDEAKRPEQSILLAKNLNEASDKLQQARSLRFQGKIQKSIQVAEESASLGSQSATTFLGYLQEIELKRYDESIKLYQKAADQGSNTGLALVGKAYYEGKGVERDEARAFEIFKTVDSRQSISFVKHFFRSNVFKRHSRSSREKFDLCENLFHQCVFI